MKIFRNSAVLVCAALTMLATQASAQTLVSRLSHQTFNAVYGGGSNVFTPSDDVSDTALTNFDIKQMSFSDDQNGFINGNPLRPWGASVYLDQGHSFTISGPLASFSSISAHGQTTVLASASGEGLANMVSGNPGNLLEFQFILGGTTSARLFGNVDLNPDGQNLSAGVALQTWDGFFWQNTFNSLFLPGQEGPFDNTYTLGAGLYRVVAFSNGNAFAGVRPSQTNAWNYELQVVPEPATMTAIGLGVLGLLKRRKRA